MLYINDEKEANEFTREARKKEEKITQWVCFGLVFICHCFIKDGYLIYFIPLISSLFSIGADWYSNWRAYYYYEKYNRDNRYNRGFTLPDLNEGWRIVPFIIAMLFFAILYLHYNLLIKIY